MVMLYSPIRTSSNLLVTHFRNLTLRATFSTVLCTIFIWYIDTVMPKIRTSIIAEHLRRRAKVLPADPSFVPSIPIFTKQFYGCTNAPNQAPTVTSPKDTSHSYTPYSQRPLLKPNVDRFNTRGRTIYNAFDCLSLEHQGYPSRLRLMHTSHKNAGKRKALPKEMLFARVAPIVPATTYHNAHSVTIDELKMEAIFKTTKHDNDADILQRADRLFEMYIKME